MENSLITKYNVPGPRYTSYPTVPYWDESGIDYNDWISTLRKSFNESNSAKGISLYIHLPYCESLCTFCGCNKRITKNHDVEGGYIAAVLKEWDLYCKELGETPVIKDLHLGGGTPTFFSPENLEILINGIFSKAKRAEGHEFSFEGHPNNTTKAHLQTLYDLGFTRVSYGIQDFDPKVQDIINRVQTYERVKLVTDWSREIGYTSVNYDIIFGLPFQKMESINDTIEKTKQLKPDRIAYYSYAHVPWIKGVGQRKFTEADLPKDELKRSFYEKGREMFESIGYREIGMDHFALESDELYTAINDKTIHRNFMGYTVSKTQLMIGLGVSSISDSWYSFAQNVKTVEEYHELLNEDKIPIFRGHLLTEEDLIIRKHILEIMCHFETVWQNDDVSFKPVLERLKETEADGLIVIEGNKLTVTEEGKPFIRNICMALDERLWANKPQTRIFSMTI